MLKSLFEKFNATKGLGLDISPTSIKAVILRKVKEEYFLESFDNHKYEQKLQDDTQTEVEEKEHSTIIMNDEFKQSTILALKGMLKTFNMKQVKRVTSSVGGSSILAKQVKFPVMGENELRSSMKWELKKYIPFDLSTVDVDFYRMKNDDSGNMDVMISAVDKSTLSGHNEIIKGAGISSFLVDLNPLAIMNSFLFNYSDEDFNDPAVIIDIGSYTTTLSIFRNDTEFFLRTIPISGNNINISLSSRLNININEAEEVKKSMELIDDSTEPVLDSMIFEIKKSLTYYNNLTKNRVFKTIYLTGGGSNLAGLTEFIQQRLSTGVEILNPFKAVKVDPEVKESDFFKENSHFLTLAVGLALRSCEGE